MALLQSNDVMKLTFASPECFPVKWDERDDKIAFHQLTQDIFRSTVFLGETDIIMQHPFLGSSSIGDILACGKGPGNQAESKHYIFHLAYCCSTLLARYFEECRSHLVLKEPAVLSNCASKSSGTTYSDDLRLVAISWLLGRVYPEQDIVVIKPNVPVNTIATQVLALDTTASGTFIVHGLEACITSIIKYQWRIDRVRAWNKVVYRRGHGGAPTIKPDFLDGVQTAAYWWIENMLLAMEFERANPTRAIIVRANDIAERPEQVLIRISGLPGMEKIHSRVKEMTSGDVEKHYSKRSNVKYDLSDREAEIGRLLETYANEIKQARDWLATHYGDLVLSADRVGRG